MALGKCLECGHEMSTTAQSCPNCGSTLPPKKARLVNCDFCKGEGYYYVHVYVQDNNQIPGHSCIDHTSRRYYPCSKNHSGAIKCPSCTDGKVEEF